MSLRALSESLLEQTSSDMEKQVGATAAALQLSVRDIKAAKSQMEDELAKVRPGLKTPADLKLALTWLMFDSAQLS